MKHPPSLSLVATLSLLVAAVSCNAGVGSTGPDLTCTAPFTACGASVCVNTQGDGNNCGACGVVCGNGTVCSNGTCGSTCLPGSTPCNTSCSDVLNDPSNCGTCGTLCGGGQSCSAGICVGGFAGAGGMSGAGGLSGTGGGSAGSGGGTTCAGAYFSTQAAALNAAEYVGWRDCWVKSAANGALAVINSGSCGSGDWVVSEGIGYGMLLAVGNSDRTTFDGLWKFYGDHLDSHGLMNWSVHTGDAPGNNDANAATDGDLDVAMALVQANAKWGGYLTAAQTLIGKIKTEETDYCSAQNLNVLRPGDAWGGCRDNGKMNPSYFAPGYYRVFATVDAANAAYWTKLANDTYPMLAAYQASMGGLVPEWSYVNGSTEGGYSYNACRTPWRVAVDYVWFCTPQAKTFLDGVVGYVDTHGGISGVPFDKNSAFLGAFALSGMASSQAKLDAYAPLWLSTAKPQDNAYFQGSLRLVYALLAGNQFPSTQ